MLKKITLVSAMIILIATIASFVNNGNFAFSYSNGSQGDGYSGSPGDGNISCATSGCHSNPSTVTGWITTNIPGTGYVPSTSYTITLTMVGGSHAFELTSEKSGGTKVGTFSSTSGCTLYNSNHAVVANSVASSKSITWTAPATGNGPVTFYACFSTSKSNAKKCTLTVSESSVGVEENSSETAISLYPNPVKENLFIQTSGTTDRKFMVYNMQGQLISTTEQNNDLTVVDLSGVEKGIYILAVEEGSEVTYSRFIKE